LYFRQRLTPILSSTIWKILNRETGISTHTTSASHGGNYAITDSPDGDYSNNVNISVTSSAEINLSAAVMPVLTFWHRYSLESNADFGYVDVSTDLGKTWTTIYFVTGYQTQWREEKIDLTPIHHH
jgi:hypothetical protein